MDRGGAARAVLAAALAATPVSIPGEEPAPSDEPRDSRLIERVGTRLAQLDVTVSGPKKVLEALTREDFEVKIVGYWSIAEFQLDRVCQEPAPGIEVAEAAGVPETAPPAEPQRLAPTSYLFYFDQAHLTLAGRQRSLDLARELLPKLVGGGNRAMIVSNAGEIVTLARFTSDVQELLLALDRLEKDRRQWDQYPALEANRVEEILQKLKKDGVERAISTARVHAGEELWRTGRDLRRLSMVLGQLHDVDPPKAVLYFADTMRSNAGDHYLAMFSDSVRRQAGGLDQLVSGPEALGFERLLSEAAAAGIRFYPVQAEGLVAPRGRTGLTSSGSYSASLNRTPSMIGVHDAQSTFTNLALETGGKAFLNGVPSAKIATTILSDLSCLYLISFDPAGLPHDKPLAVKVEVKRPGVKAQVRGRIVVQSTSARLTSRLMAAFANPDARRSEIPIRTHVIPTGYREGVYSARVQVAIGGAGVPGATWDVGASLVSRSKVREEGSGRITVSAAGAPVIFERDMSFPPGPFELVSVAHEITTDQVASRRDEGSWPNPDQDVASIVPIVVLQPAIGGFLREGKASTTGSLVHSDEDAVVTDRPTAIVGLVCRSRGHKGALRVERKLIGETATDFPPMDLDFGEDRCAQVRDLVPAGTLSPGFFRYEIRVLKGEAEIARRERRFAAIDPGSTPEGRRE